MSNRTMIDCRKKICIYNTPKPYDINQSKIKYLKESKI